MSIILSLHRLTPQATVSAVGGGPVDLESVEVFEEIDKGWDLLGRLLAEGRRDPEDLPVAARAVMGGTIIAEFLPDEVRLLTPAETPAIHTALSALDEGEIRRRYDTVDFTGCYCADGNRPTDSVERMINEVRFLAAFYQRAITDGSAVVMWCK